MQTFSELLEILQVRSDVNLSIVYCDGRLYIDVLPGKQNYIYIQRLARKDATVLFKRLDEMAYFTLGLHRSSPQDFIMRRVSLQTDETAAPCYPNVAFRYEGRTVFYYPQFVTKLPHYMVLGQNISAAEFPQPCAHLEVHCRPSTFWLVVSSYLRAGEEAEEPRMPLPTTVTDFSWEERQPPVYSAKEFEIASCGSMAWAAAKPFVGGIVTAFRADRRVTPTSDELSTLLLDRRLIRTKGALMSSFMAGAVVPFLPSFPPK